jgi:hypothetical protein
MDEVGVRKGAGGGAGCMALQQETRLITQRRRTDPFRLPSIDVVLSYFSYVNDKDPVYCMIICPRINLKTCVI